MIGFFDSGIGGLTVEQEVIKRLPAYSTIYLGDNAHAPYGEKSHDELVDLTWRGVSWLFDQGCELVIVACNTASAQALRTIQQTKLGSNPKKRILGVIRPTVEELAKHQFKRIAIFSTPATKKSEAYVHEFSKLDPTIEVISFAFPDWVRLIESAMAGSREMQKKIANDLAEQKVKKAEPQAVLLACTHYPYVKADVESELAGIPVFDQGTIVAASLENYLERHPDIEQRLRKGTAHRYVTTGHAGSVSRSAQVEFRFTNVKFEHVDLTAV